MPYIGWLW
ncbi:hypothetical protein YPPY12_3427, partial [Yersinia pestis PY-12]